MSLGLLARKRSPGMSHAGIQTVVIGVPLSAVTFSGL